MLTYRYLIHIFDESTIGIVVARILPCPDKLEFILFEFESIKTRRKRGYFSDSEIHQY